MISLLKCVQTRRNAVGILTAVLCAMCITGCEPGVSRADLNGSASFAGQPINFGTIKFVPDGAKGHSGPAGSAEIVDGRYDTSLSGAGVVPGPHRVRVTAYEEEPLGLDDETLPSLPTPPIFFNYVIEADLQGGTFEIVVPEEARGYGLQNTSEPSATAGNIP